MHAEFPCTVTIFRFRFVYWTLPDDWLFCAQKQGDTDEVTHSIYRSSLVLSNRMHNIWHYGCSYNVQCTHMWYTICMNRSLWWLRILRTFHISCISWPIKCRLCSIVRSFQFWSALYENDLRFNSVRTRGSCRRGATDERESRHVTSLRKRSILVNAGGGFSIPNIRLIRETSESVIILSMDGQPSWFNVGVMWSFLFKLEMMRAAKCTTFWSLCFWFVHAPPQTQAQYLIRGYQAFMMN